LDQIEAELRELEIRRDALMLERARMFAENIVAFPRPTHDTPTPSEKIALFLSMFRCREDVYPRLWENAKDGRKGYAPACGNEWFRGVCEKPRLNARSVFIRHSLRWMRRRYGIT